MYLINQNPVLCTERRLGENKQQQKTEMHFTIIQAESCDKVKIIIIFNDILFFIFSAFIVGSRENKVVGWGLRMFFN